jgi:hypothetical protein
MKAKLKETTKDINIDIVIENNLMSKNRFDKPKEKKRPLKPAEDSQKKDLPGTTNQSIPRLLSEYYGVMAQRDLYNMNRVQQMPFNLNQFLQNPQTNQPLLQNYMGQPMITNMSSSTQQSQPQDELSDEEGEDDEVEQEEEGEGQGAEGGGEGQGAEGGGEAQSGGGVVLTQPPDALNVSAVPTAPQITVRDMLKSVIVDSQKEEAFLSPKDREFIKQRNNYINRITGGGDINLHRTSVIKYKVGKYIQEFRPALWRAMIERTEKASS